MIYYLIILVLVLLFLLSLNKENYTNEENTVVSNYEKTYNELVQKNQQIREDNNKRQSRADQQEILKDKMDIVSKLPVEDAKNKSYDEIQKSFDLVENKYDQIYTNISKNSNFAKDSQKLKETVGPS
jgi:ABC-type transporter MlaC component